MAARSSANRSANITQLHRRSGRPLPALNASLGNNLRMPAWLNAEARREWRRIVPELVQRGAVCELDLTTLALYCAAWSDLVAAERALSKYGLTYTTPRGIVRPRPEVEAAHNARQALLSAARELGLSPNARRRIQSKAPPDVPQ